MNKTKKKKFHLIFYLFLMRILFHSPISIVVRIIIGTACRLLVNVCGIRCRKKTEIHKKKKKEWN